MSVTGVVLRAAALALYIASFICFAAGARDAFDLLLMAASIATLTSVATDPKVRALRRDRRRREQRFFDARRKGTSPTEAWAVSQTASPQGKAPE